MSIQRILERWKSGRDWCLVRWMSGYTTASLRERRTGHGYGDDPETGASFCGPLSMAPSLYAHQLGSLGFENETGDIVLFETEDAAAEWVEHDNPIKIDLPCPLSALHFSCQEYDHYDGFTRFWYDGGDLFEARAVLGMRIADTLGKPGANYLKIRVECHPLWGRLGRHRPTAEQALAMYQHSERITTREAG